MPGPQILVILTTFPIEKVNFVILPIRGQWKCHFDPILTPFWALLSPNLWPPAKMCLFWPTALEGPWRDLTGPQFDPNFDHFGPFEGPERRLRLDPSYKLPLGWRTCSEPHKPMPVTPNFGHFDHFSYWKSQFCHFAYQGSVKMPFWPYFDPFWALLSPNFGPWPKCAYLSLCLDGPWRGLEGP